MQSMIVEKSEIKPKFDKKAYNKQYRETHREELKAKNRAVNKEKKLKKLLAKQILTDKEKEWLQENNDGRIMEKFNIAEKQAELYAVADKTGTQAAASIQLIVSNMILYNDLIDEYCKGNKVKSYFMYQLNSTIFKQLAAFGCVPPKVKETKKSDESALADIIKAVNKR